MFINCLNKKNGLSPFESEAATKGSLAVVASTRAAVAEYVTAASSSVAACILIHSINFCQHNYSKCLVSLYSVLAFRVPPLLC